MTNGERRSMWAGVGAGTMIGLALGGIAALVIALRPGLFAVFGG